MIITERAKYPRTLHLPWSISFDEDKVLESTTQFVGAHVVVTEKMDGENTTLTSTYMHARSLDSRVNVTRHWVKALHARIKGAIPENWRIVGENVHFKHAIYYDKLPSFFLVFAIFDENNDVLSWDETTKVCSALGLQHVPVLYDGLWNEQNIKDCFTGTSKFGDEQEGYVVRVADSFPSELFTLKVAKFVRPYHIAGNLHWSKHIYSHNQLARIEV